MKNCPKCGSSFAEESASGLCPACLLRDLGRVETHVDLFPSGGGRLHERVRYFGEYELVHELGRGGMGVVYKARQMTLDRHVALKMIVAGGFAPNHFVERFRMEARAIASLDHPNIVPLYEVGEYEGQQYFTMKLVEGVSLFQRIRSGGLEVTTSVRLVSKLAHAAHFAHQRGILHRDLKPGNILLSAEGEPFIADFGLAKAMEADTSITATGIAGTPVYMAPEQFDPGRVSTTGVDIYSLGAILYELFTGRPPFAADSALRLFEKTLTEMPASPRQLNARVDRDLETICLRCLEKHPSARYPSAEALALDLERWLRKEPILARPASAPERVVKWVRRKPVIASLSAAIIIAILLGMAGVVWQWRRAEAQRNLALERTHAERKARIAEAAAKEHAQNALARLEMQEINELSGGQSDTTKAKALPFLARSLRQNPGNGDLAFRLLMTLMHESFAWPLYERKMQGHKLLDVSVETNGVITLARKTNGSVVLLNAASNAVLFASAPERPVQFAQFSGSAKQIVLQYTNLAVEVFHKPFANTKTITFTTGAPLVETLFDPEHDRLFTVERSNWHSNIRAWELSTGKALAGPFEQTGVSRMSGLTLDEQRLVVSGGTLDLNTGIFSARSGQIPDLYPQSVRISSIGPGPHSHAIHLGWGFGNATVSPPLTEQEVERKISEALLTLVDLPPVGGVKAMDLRPRKALPALFPAGAEHEFTRVSQDGRRVAITSGRRISVRDTVSGQVLWTHRFSSNSVPARIELSPSGDWLWLAPLTGPMRILQAPGNGMAREIALEPPENVLFDGASFNRDASRVAVSLSDGGIYLYNTATGELRWRQNIPVSKDAAHLKLVFLSDDQHVLASRADTIVVLNASDGSIVANQSFPQDPLAQFRLIQWWVASPDSRALAVTGPGSVISIYTLPALQKALDLPSESRLSGIKFSPDGRLLAVLSQPDKVRLWHWSSKQLVSEFALYCDAGTLAFSPDSRRVLLGGSQISRIFDIQTGSALTDEFEVVSLPNIIETRWTSDDFLVRVALGGAGWTYELPRVGGPVPKWLPELAEALAGERLSGSGLATKLAFSDFEAVKAAILKDPVEGFYRAFGRWFISDPLKRTCSPRIQIDVLDSISPGDSRGVRGSGTDQALAIAPGNQSILNAAAKERLGFLFNETPSFRSPEDEAQQARYKAKIAWNTMELMRIHNPESSFVSFLKAAGWLWTGRAEKALQALGQPAEPFEYYWIIRAHALSKHDPATAKEAWEQAYALTQESGRKGGVASQFREFLASRGLLREAGRVNCQILGIPERRPETPSTLVDLSLSYNVSPRPSTNPILSEPHLENLPLGVADFAQTPFDIRGVVDLRRRHAPIKDVPLGLSSRLVHFLHGSMVGSTNLQGRPIGTYVVYYADGSKEKIGVIYGKHLRACFTHQDPGLASNAVVAWTGASPLSHQDKSEIRLFKMSWDNPKPSVPIDRIGFDAAFGSPLLLFGMTVDD